jgi:hypothetical protein
MCVREMSLIAAIRDDIFDIFVDADRVSVVPSKSLMGLERYTAKECIDRLVISRPRSLTLNIVFNPPTVV